MRRVTLAMLALAALGPAGCFLFRSGTPSIWPVRARTADESAGPDVVFMDISVLQTSVGDRYVNNDVWTAADEQVLPAATRLKLLDHGIRVGVITGRSDRLLELLTSRRANPHAVQSRRKVGNSAPIALTSETPSVEFPMLDGELQRIKKFEKASCQLQVVPSLDDGKVRLQFTPQIEFDDNEKWNRIDPKLALPVQGKRSTESLTSLKFDVTLGVDDYVVIGTRLDLRESLGFRFFVTTDEDKPQQRLVAVRAGRFLTANSGSSASNAPLARQAAAK